MSKLAERIKKDIPDKGVFFLYWLGGVAYIIKTSDMTIGLDLYLSDSCRNERDDFKRLVPAPVLAEELELDFLIATHEHNDHFDIGSIDGIINDKTKTRLIGPGTVMNMAKEEFGIDAKRLIRLDRNKNVEVNRLKISGVFSDHGEYSPDAIGVIIRIEGRSIYFTGDTCYRVDLPELIPIKGYIDLLIVPINGKYGNPDSKDAAYITAWVKPKTVIPCHFWMFKEHGGDPGAFIKYCSEIAPTSRILVPAIGEQLIL